MSIQKPVVGSDGRPIALGEGVGAGEASLQAGLGAWASAISADDNAQAAIALAEAINRARDARAGQENRAVDARIIATGRLETLRAKLAPVYAAIPRDVELFDLGMVGHTPPRLFVDIIAFVEIAEDKRGFRLVQETRTGRVLLGETGDERQMIALVTNYIAERLVERERALAVRGAIVRPQPLPKVLPSQVAEPLGEKPAAMPEAAAVSTAVGSSTMPAPSAAMPAMAATGATVVSRTISPAADVGRQAGQQVVSVVPEPTAMPETGVAAGPLAAASLQPKPASSIPPAAPRRSTSGWLWPLLALLIGVGLGALALYLYALSLNRI